MDVFCQSGTVHVHEAANYSIGEIKDTGVPCGTPTGLRFENLPPNPITIDLSAVSPAAGFTGIDRPNLLTGGFSPDTFITGPMAAIVSGGLGNDIVIARNGVADLIDCGDGLDVVETDMAGVDVMANCEVQDFVPTPAPVVTPPARTGKRAAAVKRCKAKHRPGKARRKCVRNAQKLPV